MLKNQYILGEKEETKVFHFSKKYFKKYFQKCKKNVYLL